jgi:hypothetical protein
LLAQADGTTNLVGKADVIVNGKFAQFGGRMMTSVSDMILQQFADNFSIKAQELKNSSTSINPSIHTDSVASETNKTPSKAPHTELNGLAIAWMLIKNFFKGLVGIKS